MASKWPVSKWPCLNLPTINNSPSDWMQAHFSQLKSHPLTRKKTFVAQHSSSNIVLSGDRCAWLWPDHESCLNLLRLNMCLNLPTINNSPAHVRQAHSSQINCNPLTRKNNLVAQHSSSNIVLRLWGCAWLWPDHESCLNWPMMTRAYSQIQSSHNAQAILY